MTELFIISRIAKQNSKIKGRTLYLTNIGMWSLNRMEAANLHKTAAEDMCEIDPEYKMEPA